jgi:hypothetical protein
MHRDPFRDSFGRRALPTAARDDDGDTERGYDRGKRDPARR